MKRFSTFAAIGLLALTSVAQADDAKSSWELNGDLYMGASVPFGTTYSPGMAMGGRASGIFESANKAVLIYGELQGQGFNAGGSTRNIQFSQFYLNTGLMIGTDSVKWKTPLNFTMERDLLSNESVNVRYAFSGLYLKLLDEKSKDDPETKQLLELVSDFIVEQVNYQATAQTSGQGNNPPICDPKSGSCNPVPPSIVPGPPVAYSHTVLGLYAAIKYEIERHGWGSLMSVELVQDISPGYSKVNARIMGYKQLSGQFKTLRPYIELDGSMTHDELDSTGTLKGAISVFGGITGTFGK